MAVGLVVLDLDGTCLDHRQRLHPRIALAVAEAVDRVPVIIATGRMYRSALPWARRLRVRAPLLCYQGAWAQEVAADGEDRGRILFRDELEASVADSVITLARTNGWHRLAFRDDRALCEESRPETQIYATIAGVTVERVDDLIAETRLGSTKIVCVIENVGEAARCRALMCQTLGTRATVTKSLPQYVEITSPTATKGRGLARLCGLLGIGGPIVAVGDAPNDADLLDAADFGVAVRSADNELLEHAIFTCAPPQQAGVADVLRALDLSRA